MSRVCARPGEFEWYVHAPTRFFIVARQLPCSATHEGSICNVRRVVTRPALGVIHHAGRDRMRTIPPPFLPTSGRCENALRAVTALPG